MHTHIKADAAHVGHLYVEAWVAVCECSMYLCGKVRIAESQRK